MTDAEHRSTVWRQALVWFLLVLAALLALFAGTSSAAEAQELTEGELEILRVDDDFPPQIWVEVAVVGGPAGTLSVEDFVFEGVDPASDPIVRPVSTEGFRVVLVVDTSGSMQGDAIRDAKAAASEFVELLPAGSEIAIVSAGAGADVIVPLTADLEVIQFGLDSLSARGETAVYDGVTEAVSVLGEPADGEQRFIVALTDGADTVSGSSLEEAAAAVAGAGVTFHGVSLETSEGDAASLQAFAEAADAGFVVPASNTAALEDAYDRIGAAVVGRYEITFLAAPGEIPALGLAGGAAPLSLDVAALELAEPAPERTVAPVTTFVPVTAPEPAAAVREEPTGLAAGLGLKIGLGLLAGGLLILMIVLAWPVEETRRTARPSGPTLRDDRKKSDGGKLGALPDVADAMLGRFVKKGRMNELLERAGLPWRAGEYLVLMGAAAVLTAMAGAVLLGNVLGLLAGIGGPALGRLYLLRRAELRKKAFREQLSASLQLLAGNLRVGHGLMSALDSVAAESEAPTSTEFQRVVAEVRLGRGLGEAIQAMAVRLESDDLQWVGEAVEIQRDVGGDLAEVLDNVAETLAERARLEGHVAALSADGRMSAAVMMGLPFVVAVLMSLNQPDYLAVFVERPAGRVLLAVGIGLMVVGGLWLKKLTKLVF